MFRTPPKICVLVVPFCYVFFFSWGCLNLMTWWIDLKQQLDFFVVPSGAAGWRVGGVGDVITLTMRFPVCIDSCPIRNGLQQ